MAIGDFFSGLGQRVGKGLTAVGGYDPMEQVSSEEAARRRQEGLAALQRSLGRSSAILSGDPRRIALAEQQTQMAEQKKALRQFALDNPQYADMIKLQELGLDPRLAAGTTKTGSVERFSIFSNKAGRVIGTVLKTDAEGIAAVQADPDKQIVPLSAPSREKDGSVERFGVYDQKTNKLIGTVLKTDTQRIGELEVSGYTVGQLRSPTIPTNKSPSMNTWAITNAAGDRVKDLVNPTQEELNAEIKAGNFVNKTPVLSTAGKGAEVKEKEIKGWTTDDGLYERARGVNPLIASGNRIIKNLYENPGSVLITGDISQVFAQMSEEMAVAGYLIDPEKKEAFVNKATNNVRNQFKDLAAETSITESQLLDFAYQIAKVRGQEGRGLSDQDFKNFQKIISAGRTADQKIAALTNFIEGIQSEVSTSLQEEKKYRNLQIGRDKNNQQALDVLQGIEDVYSVGFTPIYNPYAQPTTGGTTSSLQNDPLGIR